MKGSVTRGLLTRDVRSADGWQIGMDVFDQYVQVTSTSTLSPSPSAPPNLNHHRLRQHHNFRRNTTRRHNKNTPQFSRKVVKPTLQMQVPGGALGRYKSYFFHTRGKPNPPIAWLPPEIAVHGAFLAPSTFNLKPVANTIVASGLPQATGAVRGRLVLSVHRRRCRQPLRAGL